ncbi:Gram-negative bacterial tonB protein [compost metagenome]
MPIFATEAIVTAPVDVAPVDVTAPTSDSIAPSSPLEGVTLRYQHAPAPAYPRDALVAGAQGTVTLRVLVNEDGSPLEVTIEHSSGNRSLDNAARNQVLRRWKFQPAVDGGRPVQAYGLIPVDFKLG